MPWLVSSRSEKSKDFVFRVFTLENVVSSSRRNKRKNSRRKIYSTFSLVVGGAGPMRDFCHSKLLPASPSALQSTRNRRIRQPRLRCRSFEFEIRALSSILLHSRAEKIPNVASVELKIGESRSLDVEFCSRSQSQRSGKF
jgi:hypothetical protein